MAQKLSILFTIPFPEVKSSIHELAPMLIDELEKRGCKITIFPYGRHKERISIINRISQSAMNLIRYIRNLNAKRIEIIHLNTSFDFFALLRDLPFIVITRLLRRKTFAVLHGSVNELLYSGHPFWRFLIKMFFLFVHKVGVLSHTEKKEFSSRFSFAKGKLVVVRNPVEIPEKKTIKKTMLTNGSFIILYASRIIEAKGIFEFINAIPYVKSKIPARYVIAGGGTDEQQALTLIKGLGVENRVTWIGEASPSDMANLFEATHLFIFPSRFPEGMPMALLHALSYHLPIITTKVRFAIDYLKEPANCLFVPTRSAKAIAEKINFLYSHPDIRKAMINNNSEMVRQFRKEKVVEGYMQVFESIQAYEPKV